MKILKSVCPECGNLNKSSIDCICACCSKCERIYVVRDNLTHTDHCFLERKIMRQQLNQMLREVCGTSAIEAREDMGLGRY
jgi:hypothetical protein